MDAAVCGEVDSREWQKPQIPENDDDGTLQFMSWPLTCFVIRGKKIVVVVVIQETETLHMPPDVGDAKASSAADMATIKADKLATAHSRDHR